MSSRECAEGIQRQGENETITYTITTTNWESSPTSPSMVVKDSDGTVVTTTAAPSGSITATLDVITLKPITALTIGEKYTVEVQFTCGAGNPFECYFYIDCEE